MARVVEIAPEVFQITVYQPYFDLQFSHFLVRDTESLLFSTGFRATFADVRDAVSSLIDPAALRWIGFSHFEADECGALNEWLSVAPRAVPVCSYVGVAVNLWDFSDREPRGLANGETLVTGDRRFRFCSTAHVPHGWDAGVLFEETDQTLFCSDLFHQFGDVEPWTEQDVLGRATEALQAMEASPLARYFPYTARTGSVLEGLASLEPRTLAIMHGSSFRGNGAQALRDLDGVLRETLDYAAP